MDPILLQAGVDLAVIGARNTASSIWDRIRALKSANNQDQIIQALQDIINDLINDKLELQRIADVYREAVAAQTLSDDDLELIADRIPSLLRQFGSTADLDPVLALLDADMLRIAQALGFNFKAAIGQPLTEVAAQQIEARLAPRARPHNTNPPRKR